MSLFNKPKKKVQQQIRRKHDDDDDDEGASSAKLEDIKDIQKARERKNGLNEIECAIGKERAKQLTSGEEVQMAGGGIVMTQQQKAKLEAKDIEKGMKDQFEKESLLRDEHEELRKFIESGLNSGEKMDTSAGQSTGPPKLVDSVLARAASKVAKFRSAETGELLSNQMLAGIPEVDLGINARITNILETEKKKKQLLDEAIIKGRTKENPIVKTDVEEAAAKRKRFSTDEH
ncbi:unnamed protein product, partial [Mesorhabditis belari]|uniref:Uncharacterized protein n=1 Tax=Mesorhabditis belari TaxID=2138241 RepID=A0AAF3F5K4_9BILA